MLRRLALILTVYAAAVACRPAQIEQSIDVIVRVDGREEALGFSQQVTVDQVLGSARIELDPRDRVSHPLVSLVDDGMAITVRRVREKQICQQQNIDFDRLQFPREGIAAGLTQLGQAGAAGIREACYRVIYEDDVEREQVLLGDPVVIREPIDEIVYISIIEQADPLFIPGRLSYINHGNAWTISENVVNKNPLTQNRRLDSLVFEQSHDGKRLLFTSDTSASDDFFNEFWLARTDGGAEPARLTPSDVLYAEWRPYTNNVIAYSTGERSVGEPGWTALNNLWLVTIELESGRALTIEEALPESRDGLLSWWGTHFAWSPYGDNMAWARADGIGLVDFEENKLKPLASYALFHSATPWVWLSQMSWSHDNQLIASIVHGAPLGDEPDEKSPIFDLTVTSADGRFSTTLQESAGMWAAPMFSPDSAAPGAEFSSGYIAWLQARESQNSMSGEYDLVVADRDGSNKRRLFPAADAPGIRMTGLGLTAKPFVWSPDGQFVAVIYQDDLWLVAIESGQAHQVTFDGGSSRPVWTRDA